MRNVRLLATAAAIAVSVTGAAAQGKSGNGPKGGAAKVSAPSPKGGAQAATTGGSAKTVASGAGAAKSGGVGAAKKTAAAAPVSASAAATPPASSTTPSTSNPAPTSTAATTTSTAAPVAPVPNPVSTKISKNAGQLARVKTMLPEGMTLEQASVGFRNQGQFLAALNASKSQGVNFVDLQAAMTSEGLSLGQAVKQLKTAPPAPVTSTAGSTTAGTTTTGTTTGATTGTTTGATTIATAATPAPGATTAK
jgi:hypothetical protein